MEYNVLDFGAVGNARDSDTRAIQAAIDACCNAGGGKVVFPGGHIYRCGALILRSNLELHLEMGAVLLGSDHLDEYLLSGGRTGSPELRGTPSYENCEYTGAPNHYFLYAANCENLAITGHGIIDGNEAIFHGEENRWHIEGIFYPRPPLLFLENVSHLTIERVTLRNSAFWTVHMVGCRDVLIDGIRILNNLRMANCDGIDPDHCRNVRITNCHIECADDCIVFKNTAAAMQYGSCENIVVSGCTLTSTSAAIKFGSESEDTFRNILVENCIISRSNRGISLQLRDPGSIENCRFHNLCIETRLFHRESFWGAAEPIAITVLKRKADTEVGAVRRISFSNISCESENGILLYSETPSGISDISFDRVSLHLRRSTNYETGFHDLRPCTLPPFTEAALCHIYARSTSHVTFRDCDLTADPSMTAALHARLHCEDCENFTV